MTIHIYSGQCRFCVIGTPVIVPVEGGKPRHLTDMGGKKLFTGDIVMTYTDMTFGALTAVVREEFKSFSGGEHKAVDPSEFFAMGIRSVPLEETGDWRVLKIKDWSDIIPGEHWRAYGFNYQLAEAA